MPDRSKLTFGVFSYIRAALRWQQCYGRAKARALRFQRDGRRHQKCVCELLLLPGLQQILLLLLLP